jgi:hypothetical protein
VSVSLGVSQEAQAYESTGEMQEGPDRRGVPVVADRELAQRDHPCLRALDDPAVPPQSFTRLHTPPRNPRGNPALPQGPPLLGEVIPFIRVQLGRALSGESVSNRGLRGG